MDLCGKYNCHVLRASPHLLSEGLHLRSVLASATMEGLSCRFRSLKLSVCLVSWCRKLLPLAAMHLLNESLPSSTHLKSCRHHAANRLCWRSGKYGLSARLLFFSASSMACASGIPTKPPHCTRPPPQDRTNVLNPSFFVRVAAGGFSLAILPGLAAGEVLLDTV